ncbi:MAG: hypothetical protein ACREO3_02335 [Arenimonas sp.]
MNAKPTLFYAFLVVAALAAPVAPARAATDFKFVHGTGCVAFGPNTQVGELQISPAGIYNPGTSVERVICPMPRDQDDAYISGDVDVTVYYRGLSTPGRVTCTLYVGSVYMQVGSVYTNSVVGDFAGNGVRDYLVIQGAGQTSEFLTAPVNVLCALDPKMALAGLFFNESGPTNTP